MTQNQREGTLKALTVSEVDIFPEFFVNSLHWKPEFLFKFLCKYG